MSCATTRRWDTCVSVCVWKCSCLTSRLSATVPALWVTRCCLILLHMHRRLHVKPPPTRKKEKKKFEAFPCICEQSPPGLIICSFPVLAPSLPLFFGFCRWWSESVDLCSGPTLHSAATCPAVKMHCVWGGGGGGVASTRLLTHNTSALLSRQPYPTAPVLLQYWPVGFSQGPRHNDT